MESPSSLTVEIEVSVLEKILYRLTSLEEQVKILNDRPRQASSSSFGSVSEIDTDEKRLVFSVYKKSILASGNTLEHRERLKRYKGKWNNNLKGWIFYRENGVKAAAKMKKKLSEEKILIKEGVFEELSSSDSSDSE